jgi:hypothetical protein
MRREKGVRYEQSRNPDAEEGGVVKISGKFLLDHEEDVLNLVKKEGKLAEERNNNTRIVNIDKNDGIIVVQTSSHNLAQRIGKALHSAYKGDHQFKFREGEKFAEVVWRRD